MLENWDAAFPHSVPVAHLLREQYQERWVRFHSLPESKRYPENEDEVQEVLSRHNAILGELLSDQREVMLLTTGYSKSSASAPRHPELLTLDPNAVPWRAVPMHQHWDFDDPTFWHVTVSGWTWRPRTFDPLVRLIADDVIADVMMLPPDCGWMLHPYDGGMDVILDTPAARDRLKSAHREWLSDRPDGL